ncbi:MAG: endolytic transglycosylase MltG [Porticoccus sp.]
MLRLILRWLLLCLALVTLGIMGGYWVLNDYLDTPLSGGDEPRVIEVESGSSLTKVARQLADHGILKRPALFTAYARLTSQTSIRVGEYPLDVGDTPRKLLERLMSGKVIYYQVTFPEGLNFKEWLSLIAEQPKLTQSLNDLTVPVLLEQLGLDINHPEGWFFPDTYSYSAADTDRDLLLRAHARMREVLDDEWQSREDGLPYQSLYEALTLASIVEKETGVGSERSQIAGVFVRRLKKGMRLQTDPTVIYGLGDQYQGNITRRHLKQETPYNTYLIKGLPPTPIAMPGREAIHATLHPAKSEALYFVAKGDGSHYFSATLEEHLQAVRRYQLQRRSNYRSSPNDPSQDK